MRDAKRYNWFDPPVTRPDGQIAVIPGQTLQFGTFSGHSVQPRITRVRRTTIRDAVEQGATITPNATDRGFSLVEGEPTDTIVVTWQFDTRNTHGDDGAGNNNPYTAADVADDAGLTTALGPRFTPFAAPSGGFTTATSFAAGATSRGTEADGTSVRHRRTTTGGITTADEDDDDYRHIYGERKIGHVSLIDERYNQGPRLPTTVTATSATKAACRSGTWCYRC